MSMETNCLEAFLINTFPIILVTLGIGGNVASLVVYSQNKLANISEIFIYRLITISKTLLLIAIGFKYLLEMSGSASILSCILTYYITYSMFGVIAWSLSYLSFHRYYSIKSSSSRLFFMNKKSFQLSVFIFFLSINFMDYLPYFIYIESGPDLNNLAFNESSQFICQFIDPQIEKVLAYFDFMNSLMIPFIFMGGFSSAVLGVVIKSRQRISHTRSVRLSRRDVKLVTILIMYNLLFVVCNMPVTVFNFFSMSSKILENLSNSYVGIDFFINMLSNSIFRKEFTRLCLMPLKRNQIKPLK